MNLYKYTSFDIGLKILLDKKIRYTQPICFNDPFELNPAIEEYFTNEQLGKFFDIVTQEPYLETAYKMTIDQAYENLNDFQKSLITYEQYYSIMKLKVQDEMKKQNVSIRQLLDDKIKDGELDLESMMNFEYHKLINSSIGILSLSKNSSNILMWGHYSNSHTGVAIKVRNNNSYFQYLEKVHYPKNNERPKIKLSKRDYTPEESTNISKKVFFTKSIDWAYENEYRDYKTLISGSNTGINDDAGFPIILFDFPEEIIEGVIFGARVSDNKIIEFMNKVENIYTNITFEKAFLDQEKYQLNILENKKAV